MPRHWCIMQYKCTVAVKVRRVSLCVLHHSLQNQLETLTISFHVL